MTTMTSRPTSVAFAQTTHVVASSFQFRLIILVVQL